MLGHHDGNEKYTFKVGRIPLEAFINGLCRCSGA